MINRNQVESILKANGVTPNSPDDQIRSVLLSARFNDEEVEAAVMVLRQNTKTNKTQIDGLHKVFRTNEALNPHEISNLLGIEVGVRENIVVENKARAFSVLQFITVWILSVVLAAGGLFFFMYTYHIGPFHPGLS